MKRRDCPSCGKSISVGNDGELRVHGPAGDRCVGGRRPAPKTPEAKADRYLEEGRVRLVSRQGERVVLTVSGTRKEPYIVIHNGLSFTCDCEARIYRCAHVIAAGKLLKPTPTARIQAESELDEVFERKRQEVVDPLDAHSLEELLG